MTKINVFRAPNDGRIEVSRDVGSKEKAMYIYDM